MQLLNNDEANILFDKYNFLSGQRTKIGIVRHLDIEENVQNKEFYKVVVIFNTGDNPFDEKLDLESFCSLTNYTYP